MKQKYFLLILMIFNSISIVDASEPSAYESMLGSQTLKRIDDKNLVITANNGKKVHLKDSISESDSDFISYSIMDIDFINNYLVIYEQYWEGGAYALLNLDSGKYTQFDGYPSFSSTGSYLVVFNLDIEAGYSPNVLQVFQHETGKFILNYDAKPDHSWGAISLRWLSPIKIEFLMANSDCYFDDKKVCEKYFLTYEGQSWIKSKSE